MLTASARLCSRLGSSWGRSLARPVRAPARCSAAAGRAAGGQAASAASQASPPGLGAALAAAEEGSCDKTADEGQPYLRVSYMSTMKVGSEDLDRTIRQIAVSAAQRNSEESITGFLSYDATLQTVWQILEGRPAAVMELWAKIRRDGRHIVDSASVSIEGADRRAYPGGWGLKMWMRSANEI